MNFEKKYLLVYEGEGTLKVYTPIILQRTNLQVVSQLMS